MPAKISITGVPTDIVTFPDYYRVTIETGSTAPPPKGLPAASAAITYSILVSHKLGTQLGLPHQKDRLLFQGEVTLDLPLTICPGEIGVIAFQGQVLAEKPAENPIPLVSTTPKAVTPPAPIPDWPDLSACLQVPLATIQIPHSFLKSPPNKAKTKTLREIVKIRNQLDQPIAVQTREDGGGYVLLDGYRRYIVAQQLEWLTVPVIIQNDPAGVSANEAIE